MSKLRIIVTGSTGMVGEGVLHECLNHPDVEEVLILNRRSLKFFHPKLIEVVHETLEDWNLFDRELPGYDACFFCLGVSSVGMQEEEYTKITYDYTIHVAEVLTRINPNMVFCYVSGSGTDSSEQGRSMWARVKGRTENKLLSMPFKHAYMFRPGYLHPTPGLKNTHRYYAYISWLYPAVKLFLPKRINSLRELGLAMIHIVQRGYDRSIIGVKDIHELAKP